MAISKSKYVGQTIGCFQILDMYEKRLPDWHHRYKRFKVKCIYCGMEGDHSRFNVLRETAKCPCQYKIKYQNSIGEGKTKLYIMYMGMLMRCNNPNSKAYKNYGGRGIKICDEWKNNYISFKNWALENGYKENLTIDRIDVNGNYEPENCRWVDRCTQANNKTNNRFLTYNGKTMTIAQWARHLGVSYSTIQHRLYRGQPLEKILREEVI